MMVLYSGTTCPFSHRCRFVLFEKGMDFEIRDVDLYNKPEDINVMNPYGQVPILVERDLILYESNIINEYIDERFPHPQLMPGDPVDRARVRLFLLNFEKELFVHVSTLESRAVQGQREGAGEGPLAHPRPPDPAGPGVPEEQVHAGRELLDARRRHRAAAVAPGLLRHRAVEERRAAAEVRRAHLLAPGLHRGADAVRKGDAQVSWCRAPQER
jgi:glutathione S-transferase